MVLHIIGAGPWAAAAAVGLSIVAMHLSGNPLVVPVNGMPWRLPGRSGCGKRRSPSPFAWHNVVSRASWPVRWW
jgi:hypothetical protein